MHLNRSTSAAYLHTNAPHGLDELSDALGPGFTYSVSIAEKAGRRQHPRRAGAQGELQADMCRLRYIGSWCRSTIHI